MLQNVIRRGTRASQPAATAVSIGTLYCVTDEGLIIERSNGTTWDTYSGVGGTSSDVCQGRLTTETGVPISTSDRTAQGTLFFTPSSQIGIAITTGQIALYNGTSIVVLSFSQLSLALTVTSGSNYDVFVNYNAGVPALALSAAWTNDTTRATALTVQSGIIVRSGTPTQRWVGTIRASGANVTADSLALRYVWNAFNQAPRAMRAPLETTDSWNYTTDTFRQANANTSNQLEYVCGNAAAYVEATVQGSALNSTNNSTATVGVGIDSTTVNSALSFGTQTTGSATTHNTVVAFYKGYPGLGRHFIAWLERATTGGTMTWYGDNGLSSNTQSGIHGMIWN